MKYCPTYLTLLISLQAISSYSTDKTSLKGRQFDDTNEVIQEVGQWVSMHSDPGDLYNDGMHSVKYQWENV